MRRQRYSIRVKVLRKDGTFLPFLTLKVHNEGALILSFSLCPSVAEVSSGFFQLLARILDNY